MGAVGRGSPTEGLGCALGTPSSYLDYFPQFIVWGDLEKLHCGRSKLNKLELGLAAVLGERSFFLKEALLKSWELQENTSV